MNRSLSIPIGLVVLAITACKSPGALPMDDRDGDGVSGRELDCDDLDATVYPGALEVCDGKDNDCDGIEAGPWYQDLDGDGVGDLSSALCASTEGYVAIPGDCDDLDPSVSFAEPHFVDRDGDGYGSVLSQLSACPGQSGLVLARGDCDDTDSARHPFAAEASSNDGIDSDCGGTDGADPSVKDPNSRLQAALNGAHDGQVIWVGPGIYSEYELTFKGKQVSLISTHGWRHTVVHAGGLGRGFNFETGETASTVLDGFTVTAGVASEGGGIRAYLASPTLAQLNITGNRATKGGGVALLSSSASFSRSLVTENASDQEGGGLYLSNSTSTLSRISVRQNEAIADGGGLAIVYGAPTFEMGEILDNHSDGKGGAAFIGVSSPTFRQVEVNGNSSLVRGGGFLLYGSSGLFEHAAIVGNLSATDGGGLYSSASSPALVHCVVAYNEGSSNLMGTESPGASIRYSLLYSSAGVNVTGLPLVEGVTQTEPGFAVQPEFEPLEARWIVSDLHPSLASPLLNTGDPTLQDVDGSTVDIGIYGGELGAGWDRDEDGFNDYFWAGGEENPPPGFDSAETDLDDHNSSLD